LKRFSFLPALSLGLLFVLTMAGCKAKAVTSAQPVASYPQPSRTAAGNEYTHNLIIYYDAATGKAELLKAVETYGASILYDYQNFSAIAISIPKDKDITKAIAFFQKIKGVISVERDRVYHLD
jgi:hypothetical protein